MLVLTCCSSASARAILLIISPYLDCELDSSSFSSRSDDFSSNSSTNRPMSWMGVYPVVPTCGPEDSTKVPVAMPPTIRATQLRGGKLDQKGSRSYVIVNPSLEYGVSFPVSSKTWFPETSGV